MLDFFKAARHKINGAVWTMASTGVVLLMLGVLIVWTDFVLRLVVGLFILVVGYVFIYSAYKLWLLKKDIEDHFKL